MTEISSFLTANLERLFQKLLSISAARANELEAINNTFGDTKLLSKLYVEPNIQSVNPADFEEDDPISYATEKAFSMVEKFFNREFPTTDDGRNQMFILGDAGMGKSSLLLMIKLHHLASFWPNGYDCVLLKIGPDTIETLKKCKNKTSTVLLLDALDEDAAIWVNMRDRLVQILDASTHFRRVLITCRTQFFPVFSEGTIGHPEKIVIGGYKCPTNFLSLFDENQVQGYLAKRFSDEPPSSKKVTKAKLIISRLGSLSFRPLVLSHIEDLVEGDANITTEYGIYEELVKIWLRREERKIRAIRPESNVSYQSLLEGCVQLALEMQRRRVRILENKDLQFMLQYHPSVNWIHHLEVTGRSLLNRNSRGNFRFSHYSIQEFLVAYAILHELVSERHPELMITPKTLELISAKNGKFASPSKQYDLRRLKFDNCLFAGISLAGANMSEASFEGSRFQDCDLSGVVAVGANFRSAEFQNCNLMNSKFHSCALLQAKRYGKPFLRLHKSTKKQL